MLGYPDSDYAPNDLTEHLFGDVRDFIHSGLCMACREYGVNLDLIKWAVRKQLRSYGL